MRAAAITRLLDELGEGEPDAARVAEVCARYLAGMTSGDLPADAQPLWREVAQLLKLAAERPAPPKAFAAIKSWPVSRVQEYLVWLRQIQNLIAQHENERLEDEIRDKIRRHYL